jgi:hypothetical protein
MSPSVEQTLKEGKHALKVSRDRVESYRMGCHKKQRVARVTPLD